MELKQRSALENFGVVAIAFLLGIPSFLLEGWLLSLVWAFLIFPSTGFSLTVSCGIGIAFVLRIILMGDRGGEKKSLTATMTHVIAGIIAKLFLVGVAWVISCVLH